MTGSAQDARVPITMLTGFLGAGKTTMLNRLLSDPESDRIAVIVNEFGEIGIDGNLIVRRDEEMMELSNGCICCESKDDLIGALYTLYKRRLGLEKPQVRFDRIVIETTGLADPIPLAQMFFTDMNLSLTFRMDAIVTVVDLKHVVGQLRSAPEAEKQIAISDKLILNKRDLVTGAEFERAVGRVRALNSTCPMLVTANGSVRASDLIDLGLFNPNEKEAAVEVWLGQVTSADQPLGSHEHSKVQVSRDKHDHDHDHDQDHEQGHAHGHDEHCDICNAPQHLAGVNSVSLYEDRPLGYEELLRMLSGVVDRYGDDLYRVKGIIQFESQERPVILQGVQRIFSPLTYADRWPGNKPATRLVLIGKGLERDELQRKFVDCVAPKVAELDRALGSV